MKKKIMYNLHFIPRTHKEQMGILTKLEIQIKPYKQKKKLQKEIPNEIWLLPKNLVQRVKSYTVFQDTISMQANACV